MNDRGETEKRFDPRRVSPEWVAQAHALIQVLADLDGTRMPWFVDRARGLLAELGERESNIDEFASALAEEKE
jgi:hypothetical protein